MTLIERLKGWNELPAFHGDNFDKLGSYIFQQRKLGTVYPERENIFRAFEVTPLREVKVVVLGQDPYYDGNATGLAFDCGVGISPSMQKILAVYEQDYPISFAPDVHEGNLLRWAEQGVLLLNTALTVRKNESGSHTRAWVGFTRSLLNSLNRDPRTKVFIALGSVAQSVMPSSSTHLVLRHEHPAAACHENRAWDAKGIFRKTNQYLKEKGEHEIEW